MTMSALDVPIRIGQQEVGPDQPTFVIAEAGVNYNGDIGLARRLVEAAAESGADAVKFQTFTTSSLVTRSAPKAEYQKRDGVQESQYEMLGRLELAPDDHRDLLEYAKKAGITFLSTPFDQASVDMLVALGVPAIKVGSGELTNLPLLAHIGSKGLPVLLSTGMATLGEVEEALDALADVRGSVLLFHCTSAYPADPTDANLRAMKTLCRAFRRPVGYSDHTLGTAIALAAVALGAVAVEKHLTLDRTLPGPDHQASLEPAEFRAMVHGIRQVERGMGSTIKKPSRSELELRKVARRSIVAARDIRKGTRITPDMLALKRPGTGIDPKYQHQLVGRVAAKDIRTEEVITWDSMGP